MEWLSTISPDWRLVASYTWTLGLIYVLVHYRTTKKHKQGTVTTLWDFLDRNIVEIILGGLILPRLVRGAADLLGNLFASGGA